MDREEAWRLRSRAAELLEGDDNTKFYHKFANGRKNINTISWMSMVIMQTPSLSWPLLQTLISNRFTRPPVKLILLKSCK